MPLQFSRAQTSGLLISYDGISKVLCKSLFDFKIVTCSAMDATVNRNRSTFSAPNDTELHLTYPVVVKY